MHKLIDKEVEMKKGSANPIDLLDNEEFVPKKDFKSASEDFWNQL